METTIPDTDTNPTPRPIRAYFSRVNRLLFHPSRFFREDFPSMSLSETLAFGLTSAWIAAAVAFAVSTLNSLILAQLFDSWVQKILASEESVSLLGITSSAFMWSAGLVLLAPFLCLIRLFFGSLTLFFFTRLFVDDREGAPVTFRTIFGIRAAAFAGQWYEVVPIFGTILAFIANLVLVVTGIRERYRVSTRRASVIVLAPYFFMLLGVLLLFALFAFSLTQIPFDELLDFDPKQFGL